MGRTPEVASAGPGRVRSRSRAAPTGKPTVGRAAGTSSRTGPGGGQVAGTPRPGREAVTTPGGGGGSDGTRAARGSTGATAVPTPLGPRRGNGAAGPSPIALDGLAGATPTTSAAGRQGRTALTCGRPSGGGPSPVTSPRTRGHAAIGPRNATRTATGGLPVRPTTPGRSPSARIPDGRVWGVSPAIGGATATRRGAGGRGRTRGGRGRQATAGRPTSTLSEQSRHKKGKARPRPAKESHIVQTPSLFSVDSKKEDGGRNCKGRGHPCEYSIRKDFPPGRYRCLRFDAVDRLAPTGQMIKIRSLAIEQAVRHRRRQAYDSRLCLLLWWHDLPRRGL